SASRPRRVSLRPRCAASPYACPPEPDKRARTAAGIFLSLAGHLCERALLARVPEVTWCETHLIAARFCELREARYRSARSTALSPRSRTERVARFSHERSRSLTAKRPALFHSFN